MRTNEIQGPYTTIIHAKLYLCSSSKMTWNKFSQKVLFLFCGITVAICFIYIRTTQNINSHPATTTNNTLQYRRYNTTKQFIGIPSKKEAVNELRKPLKKIFIVFTYWEQLTAATKNFLSLTVLAAYGGRQVVVPFVKRLVLSWDIVKEGF